MNVGCHTTDPFGAVGCYRILWPLDEMRSQGGHDCWHGRLELAAMNPSPVPEGPAYPVYAVGLDESVLEGCDVFVTQKPLRPEFEQIARLVKKVGARLVVDLDDLYAEVPAGHAAHAAMKGTHGQLVRVLELADLVTVSTPFLEDFYGPYAARVELLPNRVRWAMWEPLIPAYEQPRRRLRVGWVGNHHFHPGAVGMLRGLLGPWLERNPDVDFVAAGDVELHDLIGVPAAQRLTIPPVLFPDLAQIVATFDVGIVPLEPGPFNEAKSALKGMEYMACGIPFVASATGEYERLVRRWPVGFLARTPAEWRRYLDALVRDHDVRRAMGGNGRAAARQVSVERDWRAWEVTYLDLLEEGGEKGGVWAGDAGADLSTRERVLCAA